jgi:CheY-like chemotaxis protein
MGLKILVVDNDLLMLEFMKDLFEEQGYEVVTADDGLSALETLKSYVPDVAFIDLVMPNIRGDRLCRIIRSMPHLKDHFLQ